MKTSFIHTSLTRVNLTGPSSTIIDPKNMSRHSSDSKTWYGHKIGGKTPKSYCLSNRDGTVGRLTEPRNQRHIGLSSHLSMKTSLVCRCLESSQLLSITSGLSIESNTTSTVENKIRDDLSCSSHYFEHKWASLKKRHDTTLVAWSPLLSIKTDSTPVVCLICVQKSIRRWSFVSADIETDLSSIVSFEHRNRPNICLLFHLSVETNNIYRVSHLNIETDKTSTVFLISI